MRVFHSFPYMTDIQDMTSEQLNADLELLKKEIIELEHKMETTHEESGGNSPEDNSQEATTDFINRAQLGEQIGFKRRRMVEIEERIANLSK